MLILKSQLAMLKAQVHNMPMVGLHLPSRKALESRLTHLAQKDSRLIPALMDHQEDRRGKLLTCLSLRDNNLTQKDSHLIPMVDLLHLKQALERLLTHLAQKDSRLIPALMDRQEDHQENPLIHPSQRGNNRTLKDNRLIPVDPLPLRQALERLLAHLVQKDNPLTLGLMDRQGKLLTCLSLKDNNLTQKDSHLIPMVDLLHLNQKAVLQNLVIIKEVHHVPMRRSMVNHPSVKNPPVLPQVQESKPVDCLPSTLVFLSNTTLTPLTS
jgi:hypothetical protein